MIEKDGIIYENQRVDDEFYISSEMSIEAKAVLKNLQY